MAILNIETIIIISRTVGVGLRMTCVPKKGSLIARGNVIGLELLQGVLGKDTWTMNLRNSRLKHSPRI